MSQESKAFERALFAQTYPCVCGGRHSFVHDSRAGQIGKEAAIKRRRRCPDCESRITTYEVSEATLAVFVEAEWRKRMSDLLGLMPDSPVRSALRVVLGEPS